MRAGGERNDRGWDGWMASPTQWTWVWVDSGSWWWTGRPGMLWFMHGVEKLDMTERLNWTEYWMRFMFTVLTFYFDILSCIKIYIHMYIYGISFACVHANLLQLCPTLCDPIDCSLLGSSVHGILQARTLERVTVLSSRGSYRPRDWTRISYVSYIDRYILHH